MKDEPSADAWTYDPKLRCYRPTRIIPRSVRRELARVARHAYKYATPDACSTNPSPHHPSVQP